MKYTLLLLFVSLSLHAQEIPLQDCPERLERIGFTQIHQMETYKKDNCYIATSNTQDYSDLIYRSYLVSKDSLLVFLSLGSGPEELNTGAKEFFFFPRDVKTQNFMGSGDQKTIHISTRYDFDFTFDAETSQLLDVTNAVVSVDPKISPDNDAGVTMTPLKGLIYELPFMINGAPSGELQKTGVMKDAFGHRCQVKVGQIFKMVDDGGDTAIKYTDVQLKNVLKKICPQIKY